MKTQQKSEIVIYQTDNNETKIQTRFQDETVFLTKEQMALLFGKAKSTINEHTKNLYDKNELIESQTLRKFGISEFQQRTQSFYNLDVIIHGNLHHNK